MKNKLRKVNIVSKYFSIPYATNESLKNEGEIVWRVDLKPEFEGEIDFSFLSIESKNLNLLIEICVKEVAYYYFKNLKK